jgi:hypothetical protein
MLVNKKQIKAYALGVSDRTRSGKFRRVSAEFYVTIESHLRKYIVDYISRLPSSGVTIK